MPTSEVPTDVNEPNKPPENIPAVSKGRGSSGQDSPVSVDAGSPAALTASGNRWIDYDTHELLEMIGELEDERRWARLREGALWAVLAHMALLLALFLLPKYIMVPPVVDKTTRLDKDEFTYMDSPQWKPKAPPKPLLQKPQIDRKTLDEMKRQAPPAPTQQLAQQQPQAQQQKQSAPAPAPPPQQTSQQSQVEAPRPPAVPARPNFAMNSGNPADQLRDAMRGAAHAHGSGQTGNLGGDRLPMHPGAGAGGVQVLSDTQGVDFSNWLQRWHWETEHTWDPLIPDEVNPPINKSGQLVIRFKVLPNGRIMDGSMRLEGSSGDVALDRAAWGALTGSNYAPLPHDFHGPYLELRAWFLYNMTPGR